MYGRLLLLLLLTILNDKSPPAAHARARLGGVGLGGDGYSMVLWSVGFVLPERLGQSREPLPVLGNGSIRSCVCTQEF